MAAWGVIYGHGTDEQARVRVLWKQERASESADTSVLTARVQAQNGTDVDMSGAAALSITTLGEAKAVSADVMMPAGSSNWTDIGAQTWTVTHGADGSAPAITLLVSGGMAGCASWADTVLSGDIQAQPIYDTPVTPAENSLLFDAIRTQDGVGLGIGRAASEPGRLDVGLDLAVFGRVILKNETARADMRAALGFYYAADETALSQITGMTEGDLCLMPAGCKRYDGSAWA